EMSQDRDQAGHHPFFEEGGIDVVHGLFRWGRRKVYGSVTGATLICVGASQADFPGEIQAKCGRGQRPLPTFDLH
ncbi:hypothetical protein, partial [Pseudomonas lactucae]